MQRFMTFAVPVVLLGILAYVVGPSLVRYLAQDEKRAPASDDLREVDGDNEEISLLHPPTRPIAKAPILLGETKRPKEPIPLRKPMRRKPRITHKQPSLEEVTGLRPTGRADLRPAAIVASANPVRTPKSKPNLSNPMAKRWIGGLSGQDAQISMGKSPNEDDCVKAYCERAPAPKDIALAGVVVKTKNIHRYGRPLVGKLKRGRYQDHTPAVYVE